MRFDFVVAKRMLTPEQEMLTFCFAQSRKEIPMHTCTGCYLAHHLGMLPVIHFTSAITTVVYKLDL